MTWTFLTVLSGSRAMSGTLASTIRPKRLRMRLAWRRRQRKAVQHSRLNSWQCSLFTPPNPSIISLLSFMGGGSGFGSRPRIYPKSMWTSFPLLIKKIRINSVPVDFFQDFECRIYIFLRFLVSRLTRYFYLTYSTVLCERWESNRDFQPNSPQSWPVIIHNTVSQCTKKVQIMQTIQKKYFSVLFHRKKRKKIIPGQHKIVQVPVPNPQQVGDDTVAGTALHIGVHALGRHAVRTRLLNNQSLFYVRRQGQRLSFARMVQSQHGVHSALTVKY